MRRRRTKYTWFPNVGTAPANSPVDDDYSGRSIGLANIPLTGQTATGIAELTFDVPHENVAVITADDPLSEFIGNDYILKRIVGKIFVSRSNEDDNGGTGIGVAAASGVLVGAGFFVARAAPSPNQTLPIGGLNQADLAANFNTLSSDCIREPWLWRRTWILGPGKPNGVLDTLGKSFPRTNAEYGSVADGPHIDSKVARRVTQDDRLFFALNAKLAPGDIGKTETVSVSAYLDYRILGALRKAKGKSSF